MRQHVVTVVTQNVLIGNKSRTGKIFTSSKLSKHVLVHNNFLYVSSECHANCNIFYTTPILTQKAADFAYPAHMAASAKCQNKKITNIYPTPTNEVSLDSSWRLLYI